MLRELYWWTVLNMAAPSHGITGIYYADLIRKAQAALKEKRRGKCVMGCCFARTTHLLTPLFKHWLPSEMLDANYSLTHCIHLTWLQATFICFLNWANLLTTRTLSAWEMAGWKTKINNSSTIESEHWRNAGPSAFQLKENMLKSDKIWCAYLMVNFVRLQTFWTPLVRITDNACIRCSCVHLLLWLQVESRSYTIRFMSCWHYTGTKKYWCQHWCCSALDWSVSCIFLFLCNLFIILLFSIKHIYVPIVPCNFVIIVSSVILVHNFLF